MIPLTAKQEAYFDTMKQSSEFELKGFRYLLRRSDFARFFDVVREQGFFAPERNPAPVVDQVRNGVWLPFWGPLDYLRAVARKAGEEGDAALAAKVMGVIRDVAAWRDDGGEPRRNYRTNQALAEILGLVPTSAVSLGDVDLLEQWLGDPYDHMSVAIALDRGALPRFLDSSDPKDWEKAARILHHVTAIAWPGVGDEREATPASVVDDFVLSELLRHHAKRIGTRAGADAAKIMIARVRQVFSTPTRREYSHLFRPLVWEDSQNYGWRSAENRTVDGLRDVLLGWSDGDPNSARTVVERMLRDDLQMIRRVGVYVLGQRWANMGDLFSGDVIAALINAGHSPELYHLLQDHFAEMTPERRSAVVRAVETLPMHGQGEQAESFRRYSQYRWLSAIQGRGSPDADRLFAELDVDPRVGRLGEHPDLESHVSWAWVGPGESPYSPGELAAFAQANALADKLNEFAPAEDWQGPTEGGLASALGDATRASPDIFLEGLPQLLGTKPIYQHAVINALMGAWEAKANVDWGRGWDRLVAFFEGLVNNHDFWQQAENAHRDLMATAIADCLRAGTKQDEHAYPAELLPRAQAIIGSLLGLLPGDEAPPDDPMLRAVNSPKGRVIEALYSQALRAARVANHERGTHREAWDAISPVFDAEFAKCKNGNFEFSTLAGTYLPQLQYLDAEWTDKQIEQIFPAEYEANTVCALDGLAYASFTRPVYEALAEHGVVERALGLGLKGRDARGRLLERIGAAYLWGLEDLDGATFAKLFRSATAEDFGSIVNVFWTVRNEKLAPEQRKRVLAFWRLALEWAQDRDQVPAQLLSALGLLAVYIGTLEPDNKKLLEAVAPHLGEGYQSYGFVAQLLRLAREGQDPESISGILKSMIDSRVPEFDYEDKLRSLLELLADRGQRDKVLVMCNQLRDLPGFKELFDRLTPR